MKESLLIKLESLCARHEEIAGLLSDIEVINDQDRFRNLSMEYAQLEDVVKNFNRLQQAQAALDSAREMLGEEDAELRELAEEEIAENTGLIDQLEIELQKLLLPRDPNDSANVFLEIRAGTGGDEAAIFAGDLFRMYSRYAESQHWQLEVLNSNEGEHGGYKEIIARIIGNGAYSQLKFESGAGDRVAGACAYLGRDRGDYSGKRRGANDRNKPDRSAYRYLPRLGSRRPAC